ncbi:MAG TPA: ribosome silencing factor [Bacteroidia bacterium]|jgi:ribosome-associated protein|nr:ribosome silencing factor [Bacteroidia bacterium]
MAKTKKAKPVAKKKAVRTASKSVVKKTKRAPAKTTKKVVKKKAKAPVKKSTPPVKKEKSESMILAESVVRGMLEKKAEKIVCLDLRKIENAVTDFFIICEANSNIQVEAIADSVEEVVKKELHQRPYRSEGWENALWVLIDYVNVVVHVFERETRYFYNLESLWADAEEVKFDKAK